MILIFDTVASRFCTSHKSYFIELVENNVAEKSKGIETCIKIEGKWIVKYNLEFDN